MARQRTPHATVAAVSAAEMQTAAISEVQVKPRCYRGLGISGEDATQGWKHLRRARY